MVNAVNDAPTATGETYEATEEIQLAVDAVSGVLANDSDVDVGDTLTAVLNSTTSNGTLDLNPDGSFTYDPNLNFQGTDTFTYHAFDGDLPSATVTVTINVANTNDAPVAQPDTYVTDEEVDINVQPAEGLLANDSDVDPGAVLQAILDTSPTKGNLFLNSADGTFLYAPYDDETGEDSFTYHAYDGSLNSATVTVTITINNINDAPEAVTDSATTNEDTAVDIDVLANDTDIDDSINPTTVAIVDDAAHGTTDVDPVTGVVTYTPDPDFNGTDIFTYTVNDEAGDTSNTVAVNLTINVVNDAPVAGDDSAGTDEDTAVDISVLANDNDDADTVNGGSILADTVLVVAQPAEGSAVANADGTITYTPDENFNGIDTFTYTVEDNEGALSNVATVTVDVGGVNDAPTAGDDSDTTNEDTPVTISVLGNDSDVDGTLDPASVTVVTAAGNGSAVSNPDGTITYTPNADFNGQDTFTYTVNDDLGTTSNEATVTVTVVSENDAPVANDDTATVDEDTFVDIDVAANDTDDTSLDLASVVVVTQPANGGAVANGDGTITYTPNPDYSGSDSFTYTIDDSDGVTSDPATVSITVNNVDDVPVAEDDNVTTPEETTVTVSVLDNDYPGDLPANLTQVWQGTNGSVTMDEVADTVTYTPDTDFTGTDTFNYQITDGDGSTDIGTVIVEVTGADPVAVDDTPTTDEDTPVDIAVLDNDFLGVNTPTAITAVTQGANGTVTFTDTMVTYTPNADFNGSDSFTYTITDNVNESSTANVDVTVNPVNDAPTAMDDAYTVIVDSTDNALDVLANDQDVDLPADIQAIFSVTGPSPSEGAVVNNGTDLSFTPASGFTGTTQFSYTMQDSGELQSTAVVTVEVTLEYLPPEFITTPATTSVLVGGKFIYRIEATDPNPQDILTIDGTYPSWLTLTDAGDGRAYLYGTPTAEDAGNHQVSLTVSDNVVEQEGTDTQNFTIQVTSVGLISQSGWTLYYVDSEETISSYPDVATQAFDGNNNTIWHTEWASVEPSHPHEIQIDLGEVYSISGLRYQPRLDSQNGRIADYEFYISETEPIGQDFDWGDPVLAGTFPNTSTEQEELFSAVTGQYIRLVALSEVRNNRWTTVAEINLIGSLAVQDGETNTPPDGTITLPTDTEATIMVGDQITFEASATDAEGDTPISFEWDMDNDGTPDYTVQNPGAVTFNTPGTFTVTMTAVDALGAADPTPATYTVNVTTDATWLAKDLWTLHYVDSEETNPYDGQTGDLDALNAFDDDINTIWHTEWVYAAPGHPHEIQINLKGVYNLDGFRYTPRQDSAIGRIRNFEFYVSMTGDDWNELTPVATGIFDNSSQAQEINFARTTGQFIRLVSSDNHQGTVYAVVAEIDLLGVQAAGGNNRPAGTIDLPTATVLNISVGDTLTFVGHGTDPDDDVMTYAWDFNGDGIVDSTVANEAVSYTYDVAGTYTVTFTVTDEHGFPDLNPPTRTVNVDSNATIIAQDNWTVHYVDSENQGNYPDPATNAFDGDNNTIWHTEWESSEPSTPHTLDINLRAVYHLEGFIYVPRQDIVNGRIQDYEFYISSNGSDWTLVSSGTFPNTSASQEVFFALAQAQFIRLVAVNSHNGDPWTAVAEINVYGTETAPGNSPPDGTISSPPDDPIDIAKGDAVDFAASASDPDSDPMTYTWDFNGDGVVDSTELDPPPYTYAMAGTFTVTFTATDDSGYADPTPDTRTVTVTSSATILPRDDWQIAFVDSEELSSGNEMPATLAIDDDANTYWHTEWNNAEPTHPHELQIFLGGTYDVEGLIYLPRQDGPNGRVADFELWVSMDGSDWGAAPAYAGTFQNSADEQQVTFTSARGRYIRFVALNEVNGNRWTTVAELNIIAEAYQSNMTLTPTFSTVIANGGTVTFTADAGVEPYTYEIVDNQSGGTIDANGNYTSGPTSGVTDTVRATDAALDYREATVDVAGPVGISPSFSNVAVNQTLTFTATDGVPPYTYTLTSNESGGTLEASTGFYQAGCSTGSDVVQVEDSAGTTATATINIIDVPVAITPTGVTLPSGSSIYFEATGGQCNYVFSIADNQSGGTIDANTGYYTAGATSGVRDYIQVTDGGSDSVQTFVDVVEASSALDQSQWSLHYVDSEELDANAPATPAVNAFDGDPDTFWHTEWYDGGPGYPHELQINLGALYDVSGIRHLPRETLRRSRPGIYEIYVSLDGVNWGDPVVTGFFPYYDSSEQQVFFPVHTAQYIRFRLLGAVVRGQDWAAVAEFNVLGAPFSNNYRPDVSIDTPADNVSINQGESVSFSSTASDQDGAVGDLTYLWDFKDPSITGGPFDMQDPGDITFNTPGTYEVTLTVTDGQGLGDSTTVTRVVKVLNGGSGLIDRTNWQIAWMDSEELTYSGELTPVSNVLDGDTDTIWHTEWYTYEPSPPHELIIDLGATYRVDGVRHVPNQGSQNGRISNYHVYVSPDGKDWGTAVAEGAFANSASEKSLLFAPKWGRYVRIVALSEVNGNPWTAMAEVNVEGLCDEPYLKLVYPQSNEFQQSPNLHARVSVCASDEMIASVTDINGDPISRLGVRYLLNGGTEQYIWMDEVDETMPDAFDVTWTGVGPGTHLVEAYICDESGTIVTSGSQVYDYANNVALGDYMIAMGDSVTWGHMDDLPSDHDSQNGYNQGYGYAINLNDLLSARRGVPVTVLNEGVLGEITAEGQRRLREVQYRNPHAGTYLFGYGANDMLGSLPAANYRNLIEQMLDSLDPLTQVGYLGEVTYTTITNNQDDYQAYNAQLHQIVADRGIDVMPPPFYSYFEANQNLMGDWIHPNGEGYFNMGTLWFNAIVQPIAADDATSTTADTPVTIDVLTNDYTKEGTIDSESVTIVTGSVNGSATANPDGTVSYTPNTGWTGTDTFTYTFQDSFGAVSTEATVTVTVD
jgi:PKD repeat protein